jgi:hypothetical protein
MDSPPTQFTNLYWKFVEKKILWGWECEKRKMKEYSGRKKRRGRSQDGWKMLINSSFFFCVSTILIFY